MTEIVIRNGVLRNANPSGAFVISAWDSTVNSDSAWLSTTSSPPSTYARWTEYEMSSTKDMASTYASYEQALTAVGFLPYFYQAQDEWSTVAPTVKLPYPLIEFNQEAAIRYNGSDDIFIDGTYTSRIYTAILRFDNFEQNKKAFVLSIGNTDTIGGNPLWTYADIHVYRNGSTNHDHLISRVGSSYKSSRITGWDSKDVHVYTLAYNGSTYDVYLDNELITSHSAISATGVWGTVGTNWTNVINTMWVAGNYGFLLLSDTYTYYDGSYGVHAITHVKSNSVSSWISELTPLTVYRYKLPSPPDTAHNSTASTTLGASEIPIFQSTAGQFDGLHQIL